MKCSERVVVNEFSYNFDYLSTPNKNYFESFGTQFL
jgi:hypothetical protein